MLSDTNREVDGDVLLCVTKLQYFLWFPRVEARHPWYWSLRHTAWTRIRLDLGIETEKRRLREMLRVHTKRILTWSKSERRRRKIWNKPQGDFKRTITMYDYEFWQVRFSRKSSKGSFNLALRLRDRNSPDWGRWSWKGHYDWKGISIFKKEY